MSKEYQIIYADPPWKYEHSISNSRKIENHYPTMSLEEIKAVKTDAAQDSILFLWATAPKLKEAIEVMESWGFNYRTCLIWDKLSIGMGYWLRNQHELLLIGIKGTISPPKPEKRISSIFQEKIREHSRKPDKIRTLISEWYPQMNKIELFARQRFEGWDVFGNQIPKEIQKLI